MVWILLVAVGVPLWLVAGALLYTFRSRRRLRRTPGVFTCRLRPAGPLDGAGWTRTRRHACWSHNVLVVHRGPTLRRCDVLAVASVTGPVVATAVKRLGERPVWLRLHLDDGRQTDLAVRNADVTSAIEPFVVASMR